MDGNEGKSQAGSRQGTPTYICNRVGSDKSNRGAVCVVVALDDVSRRHVPAKKKQVKEKTLLAQFLLSHPYPFVFVPGHERMAVLVRRNDVVAGVGEGGRCPNQFLRRADERVELASACETANKTTHVSEPATGTAGKVGSEKQETKKRAPHKNSN